MEHYYLNELNIDELNEYRKTYYRSLTLYKVVIKEYTADYHTQNQRASLSPIYDILNLTKSEENPILKEEGFNVLTFLALGNKELPIDLRFIKKDSQEMLRLKINPVNKVIQITALEWNEAKSKYITTNQMIFQDPAVKNLLERIFIGTEDEFGFFHFPRKRVR
ncbi:hypothetical protein [Fredinandcohnia sp. 179-A 10B2 NHS]|uniref:hypothetical protein n=1 Tax=Fredinandcohnia sp. 179-A 10B2 NHS TaxID=3235176 RepID=UPI00399FA051